MGGQPPMQYVQQPQYAPQQQQVMGGQPQVVYAQPPQYGQPPVQYAQQNAQPMYAQPQQPMQYGQPQVQYAQQQQPPVQYVQGQQAQPQYVQYGQPPPQSAAAGPGGVYPQVQKNAGPPPPSYATHKAKTMYEIADEKANSYGGGGAAVPAAGAAAGGQASNNTWTQPRQDAKGTGPVLQNFNDQVALQNAQALYKAMKGVGANKTKMSQITGSMNAAQRREVRRQFETQVDPKKGLLRWLKSELSGSMEKLFCGCYESAGEYDARLILNALAGAGYNSELLIEVICTRSWPQLCELRKAWVDCQYIKHNECTDRSPGKYLTGGVVKAVEDETKKILSSGHFQSLMCTLLTQQRPPNATPDAQQVMQDAETLNRYIKQEKKSAQKEKFIEIYTQRSWAHLAALSEKFSDVSKKYTLLAAIKHSFGDGSDTSQALRCITQFVSQPYDFWAEKLRKSMKGLGTNDDLLIRVVITRAEVDMQNIKTVFGQRYGDGETLKKWIKDDISGHYQRLLLDLTGYE
mmetsp:Transcript_60056/g.99156  ORF Transcript_60056/g.99156 Transcript_60056/m.99156 type:complete len:518 (+) Transcript_60056:1-1554(+)